MSRIDWKINVLDRSSDDVLTIDRSSFVDTYLPTFLKILNRSLEQISKEAIDYLIQLTKDWEQIGDAALIVYQLAVQLHYKSDEFYNKYKDILEQIKIGGYFLWNNSGENFDLMNVELAKLGDTSRKWYFIFHEVDSVPEGVFAQNLDNADCFTLAENVAPHILDHRAKRVFLGKKDGRFVKAIEFEPFLYNDCDNLCKVDDIFLLETLIHMINLNFRVFPAIDEYNVLITPSYMESLLDSRRQYYIEMPFGNYLKDMKELLLRDGFIQNAVSKFETNIINSDLFSENVNYIADYADKSPSEIRVKYTKLVHMCLTLLEDEQYKEFSRNILDNFNVFYSITDDLTFFESNPYFTFKSLLLNNDGEF